MLALFSFLLTANAADTRYELRVDGLACPYCAYGVEKKIKALEGVDEASVEIRLNEGVVIFQADTPAPITEAKLKTLVNDAGFTLRQYRAEKLRSPKE
jgi:mercuric ion binding protein